MKTYLALVVGALVVGALMGALIGTWAFIVPDHERTARVAGYAAAVDSMTADSAQGTWTQYRDSYPRDLFVLRMSDIDSIANDGRVVYPTKAWRDRLRKAWPR